MPKVIAELQGGLLPSLQPLMKVTTGIWVPGHLRT